jgi:hypothetical protein
MTVNKPDNKPAKGDDPVVIKTKTGTLKDIGGGESEIWNQRQMSLLVSALPGVKTGDKKNAGEVGSAVVSGVMDLKPKDPIEGMLAAQIVVAQRRRSICIGEPGRNHLNILRRDAAICRWLTGRSEHSRC